MIDPSPVDVEDITKLRAEAEKRRKRKFVCCDKFYFVTAHAQPSSRPLPNVDTSTRKDFMFRSMGT